MLDPRDDFQDGQIHLAATGETLVETLSRMLAKLVHAVAGFNEATRNGRLVSVRAEAPTPALLAARLIDLVAGEIEDAAAIAGAYVDGAVRTENGWVAWARVELASGPARPHLPFTLIGLPNVVEGPGETRISLTIQTVA